ncbi:efflux RND transporter permease subunit [Sorangium sp. So ce1504]
MRDNVDTLYGAIDDGAIAVRIPKHAKKELEAYLDRGLLCRGFARLRCERCEESRLVTSPELRIVPDRARAADLGVSVEAIATTLNTLLGGGRIAKYNDNGRRIDVRARLLAEQRSRPEDLARIQVRSASGALVPLTSVVSYEELPALQTITRRDRERAISIFGNVAPGHSQGEAVARVEALGRDLPAGYRLVLGGPSVTFRASMGGLLFALVLGILVAYMVLASQLNSFLHPVTVLTILPLSIAGAAFALLFAGQTDVQGRVARLRTRRAGRSAPASTAHPATPQP